MKKIVSSFLLGSLLLGANNLYQPKETLPSENIKLLFKTATVKKIKNISISNDNRIAISTSDKIKFFNLNTQEFIKALNIKEIQDIEFAHHNPTLYVINYTQLFSIDKNYNILKLIKSNHYSDLDVSNNDNYLAVFDYHFDKTFIYDLKTGKKLATIPLAYVTNMKFSPDSKKLALIERNKITKIYNTNGDLLNTITTTHRENLQNIEWLDNKTIAVFNYSNNNVLVFDVKTSNKIDDIKSNKAQAFTTIDNNRILIAKDNKLKVYNTKLHKFTKLLITDSNTNNHIKTLKLSNDKSYLVITYQNKDIKIFDTKSIFEPQPKAQILTPPSLEQKTKVITKIIEKPVIVEKKVVVEKKVYVDSHKNIKPTVEIYASQTNGIVPFTVNFKIIANDEDGKIVSYYINFAGQEAMAKGNPKKSFNYTFDKPGIYKIMVAVKDNKGAIATKKITIKAREESFEDYKKGLMGN